MRREKIIKGKVSPYKNKTTLTVYLILRGLVILALVRAVFRGEYQNVLYCALSLFLMLLPRFMPVPCVRWERPLLLCVRGSLQW